MSLNAARDGFVVWDADYQQNIVNQSGSYEAGKTSLADYRAKREPVVRALAAAYRAIAVAALDPSDTTADAAILAALEVYQAIQALTGRPPRGPP